MFISYVWFHTETLQLFTGISEFYVTRWVDKSPQEATSWALVRALVASYTLRWHCFCFCFCFFFIFLFECRYLQSPQNMSQRPLGVLEATRALGFSAGKSRTTVLRYVSPLQATSSLIITMTCFFFFSSSFFLSYFLQDAVFALGTNWRGWSCFSFWVISCISSLSNRRHLTKYIQIPAWETILRILSCGL